MDPKASEDLESQIKAALATDGVPTLYFNGFINSISSGDVLLVLQRNGKPVANLNTSYTVAKTLAEKLGALVATLESDAGTTILTTDAINRAISKPKGGGNGKG